jgi:pilus assembly protein Flp/PilA
VRQRQFRRRDDRGASAVEYGLILILVAVAIIVSVTFFGQNLAGMFERSCNAYPPSSTC